ncbi:hypothetical protein [Yersinia phage vB_YenM_P778]
MLNYTHFDNGDMTIRTDSAETLLTELEKQTNQGYTYIPDTVTMKSTYSNFLRIKIKVVTETESLNSYHADFVEFDDGTAKMIARDTTSFFKLFESKIKAGYTFVYGTAFLTSGAYSCQFKAVAQRTSPLPDDEPVQEPVAEFNLAHALALAEKNDLLEYCDKYGISLDKRKSLDKMKNELQTKVQ